MRQATAIQGERWLEVTLTGVGLVLAVSGCGASTRPATVSTTLAAAETTSDTAASLIACARDVMATRGYTIVDPRQYGYRETVPTRLVAARAGAFRERLVLVAEARADSTGGAGIWATVKQYDAQGRIVNDERAGAVPLQRTTAPGETGPDVWSAPSIPADVVADLRAVRATCVMPVSQDAARRAGA